MEKKDPAAKAKVKNFENATIEELDHMLEEDALVLLNMKKDITHSHNDELLKLKLSVLAVKKEYDVLHVENDLKERQLQALRDSEHTLTGVEKADLSNSAEAQDTAQQLHQQAATVLEDFAAEQRTIKMLTLMIKRLEKEINQCRMDTAKATVTVDHAKHDVVVGEGNLLSNRQELAEQEGQLDKLTATLKTRKEDGNQMINMLRTLSVDGENSVARIQHSINEGTRVRNASKSSSMTYDVGPMTYPIYSSNS
jgi:chromosome segregation ATPase